MLLLQGGLLFREGTDERVAVSRKMLIYILLALVVAGWSRAETDQAAKSDTAAVVEKTVDSSASDEAPFDVLDKVLGPAEPLDDIALYSSGNVFHCALGLVIRNTEGSKVSVAIHDAKGRPVLTDRYADGPRVISVDTDGFPTGVYVYTVHMADSIFTKPFIVTR